MDCGYCGRDLAGLPYRCKRCDGQFCTEHRLPESHDCIELKVAKAERALKRESGEDAGPWFKDEFRLSNVSGTESQHSSHTSSNNANQEIAGECVSCGEELLDHEIAGCPHCGEIYCGKHVGAHRSRCSEKPDREVSDNDGTRQLTKQEQLEKERKSTYKSPDVNPDGSLSDPEYADEISGSVNTESDTGRRYGRSRWIVFLLLLVAGLAAVQIFVF